VVVVDRLEGRNVVANKTQNSRPECLERLEDGHGDGALLHRHPEVPVVVVEELLDGLTTLLEHVHQLWNEQVANCKASSVKS